MKNLKVKQRLVISFLIIALVTAIVGGVGIAGLFTLNDNQNQMQFFGVSSNYVNRLIDNIQQQRIAYRDVILNADDEEKLIVIADQLNKLDVEYDVLYSYLDSNLTTEKSHSYLSEIDAAYNNEYIPLRSRLLEAAHNHETDRINNTMIELAAPVNHMIDAANGLVDYAEEFTSALSEQDAKTAYALIYLVLALAIVSVAAAVILGLYIAKNITSPLLKMKSIMDQVGNTGSLEFSDEEKRDLENEALSKDEIGQTIASSINMVRHLEKASNVLHRVADGDLTSEFKNLSDKDTMGISLNTMIDSLNSMFSEIYISSDQVSSGAEQVSQGAQELAAGSSEQAASIQEFSATLMDLRKKTEHNAENAAMVRKANNMIAGMLTDSIGSMGDMLKAMKEIDESSSSITKVIKVIDDIAFQTNILALNAAVEAARAGQHGRGFAVVADEVRNLAAKSAEAAKETAELIEGSSERVKEGNKLVTKTNADLAAVTTNAQEITLLIEQVASESVEQTKSIGEINCGIEQISAVVQANSATSEQSAAASEQMSAQSLTLKEIVTRFKLKKEARREEKAGEDSDRPAKRNESGFAISNGDSKYGPMSA